MKMGLCSLSVGFLALGLRYCGCSLCCGSNYLLFLIWHGYHFLFQLFFVDCGFCHIFMLSWCRDIRFVPLQKLKRFYMGIFAEKGRETRRGIFGTGVSQCRLWCISPVL